MGYALGYQPADASTSSSMPQLSSGLLGAAEATNQEIFQMVKGQQRDSYEQTCARHLNKV